jgi:hypothetical protein
MFIQNKVHAGVSCEDIANQVMEKFSPQVFLQVKPGELRTFMLCLAQQAYLIINKEYEVE